MSKNKSLESLKLRVQTLKETVSSLRDKTLAAREERLKAAHKKEVQMYLDHLILPYLEGVAERFNEPLEDGIKRLIEKKTHRFPTRYRKGEVEADLQRFLNTPQTRVMISIAGRVIRWKAEQLAEGADFIIDEVLSEEYTNLYEVITGTDGGRQWFKTMLQDMVVLVRRLIR